MRVEIVDIDPLKHDTELVVFGAFEGDIHPLSSLNSVLGGAVKDAIDKKEFECKIGQIAVFKTLGKIKPKRVVIVGLGKRGTYNTTRLDRAAASAAKYARAIGAKDFSSTIYGIGNGVDERLAVHKIVEASIMGNYANDKNMSERRPAAGSFYLIGKKSHAKTVDKARIEAEAANWARDIANTPANTATPEWLASKCQALAKEFNLKIDIFDKKRLKKEGLNSVLAVGKGSANEPRMVILDYNPPKSKKTVVLAGKGITFDTGGINLKGTEWIYWMWMDKCGACYVMGTMRAIAQLKPNIRVIAVLPFAENMPSGTAQRPGDVVKTLSGRTIEIANTDAEGRVLLADPITYASKKYKPDVLIDAATLTGAATVVLGNEACVMLSNDSSLSEILNKAAEISSEKTWELPSWEEFDELNRSTIADIKNVGKPKQAGSIAGGMFIKNFIAGKEKWAHLDIANVAYWEEEKYFAPQGASGFGVRLLTEFIELCG